MPSALETSAGQPVAAEETSEIFAAGRENPSTHGAKLGSGRGSGYEN